MANNKQQKNNFATKTNTPSAAATARSKAPVIIIVSVFILVAIAGGIILGAFLANRNKAVDYWNDNLKKYISISEEQYKNYTLPEIPLEKITEEGLQRKINQLLVKNKNTEALYEGAYVTNLPMSLGDVAYMWYRGYTVDENGVQTGFEGGSNFSSQVTELELGSGSFIPGFEEALIGVVPNQHSNFAKQITGSVEAGDVIYLTALIYNPDGSYRSLRSERIDLGDKEAVDAKYGEGFTEFFVGKTTDLGTNEPQKIGETIGSKVYYIGGSTMATAYYDMKIDFVTRCESNPLTIDARFPADYSKESLRGVEAKFDVYVTYAKMYDTPTFDDKFVTETLKVEEETLAGYSGTTVVEKYTELLREEYKEEVTEKNRVVLEEEMWKYYKSVVTVKKLPESSVQEFYNSYYKKIEDQYASYSSYYETIDAFAIAYLGLGSDSDWRNYLIDQAKDIVLEKLLFYYIMRDAALEPSEEYYRVEYDKIYQEYLDYYIELNAEELSKYQGEVYDREIEILKKEMESYYGENYFKESVYYDYATKIMLEYSLGEGYFDN